MHRGESSCNCPINPIWWILEKSRQDLRCSEVTTCSQDARLILENCRKNERIKSIATQQGFHTFHVRRHISENTLSRATPPRSREGLIPSISISQRRNQGHIQYVPLIRANEGLHSMQPCPGEIEPAWAVIGSVFRFNELWHSCPPICPVHS